MGGVVARKCPTVRFVGDETISGRIGDQVLRAREARGLSQRGLERVLADIGYRLGNVAISRIETGSRRANVDDVIALALALDVTPVDLLLPLGRAATVPLPTGERATWDVLRWFVGLGPLHSGDDTWLVSSVQAYLVHDELVRHLERAQSTGDREHEEQVRRSLQTHEAGMRKRGFAPPISS